MGLAPLAVKRLHGTDLGTCRPCRCRPPAAYMPAPAATVQHLSFIQKATLPARLVGARGQHHLPEARLHGSQPLLNVTHSREPRSPMRNAGVASNDTLAPHCCRITYRSPSTWRQSGRQRAAGTPPVERGPLAVISSPSCRCRVLIVRPAGAVGERGRRGTGARGP